MTENDSAPKRRRRKKEKLSVRQIAEAALLLVNRDGLDGLTMRALADAMDVQAPVIYRHVADKRQLLDEMADAIVAAVPLGGLDDEDAYVNLAEFVRRLRRTLLRYRDGARIVGGSYSAKHSTLRGAETLMELLVKAELDRDRALWAMTTLLSFILGETLEQQGLPDEPGEATATITASLGEVLASPDFRHLDTELMARRFFDFDGRFEFGLAMMLAGVREQAAGTGREDIDLS